jgi:uncharacterized glyoxalase superfamily protein PhnB
VRFRYTIIYVPDVRAAIEFHVRAFGVEAGYIDDEGGQYGELATGDTKLAFVGHEQASTLIEGGYRPVTLDEQPPGMEIAFATDDVDAAYARAVEAGAAPVAEPADKPWGQRIAYVRDLNGLLVEIAGRAR